MIVLGEEYFLDNSVKMYSSRILKKFIIMHSQEKNLFCLQEYYKILSKKKIV